MSTLKYDELCGYTLFSKNRYKVILSVTSHQTRNLFSIDNSLNKKWQI